MFFGLGLRETLKEGGLVGCRVIPSDLRGWSALPPDPSLPVTPEGASSYLTRGVIQQSLVHKEGAEEG